jgi:Flp pilus assembly protein TadG
MSIRSGISSARAFAGDRRGVAAVEFALVTPIFCLLLAGIVDLGGALYTKFRLDSAVTAGANFAQVNAGNVNSTNGQTLANNIATIVETSQAAGWADDGVVVNNGPAASVASATTTNSGTATNADVCYCPTTASGVFTWGSAVSCGTACPGTNTGYAGKFVTITASHSYSPIFSSYGIVQNDSISATAAVQVQ